MQERWCNFGSILLFLMTASLSLSPFPQRLCDDNVPSQPSTTILCFCACVCLWKWKIQKDTTIASWAHEYITESHTPCNCYGVCTVVCNSGLFFETTTGEHQCWTFSNSTQNAFKEKNVILLLSYIDFHTSDDNAIHYHTYYRNKSWMDFYCSHLCYCPNMIIPTKQIKYLLQTNFGSQSTWQLIWFTHHGHKEINVQSWHKDWITSTTSLNSLNALVRFSNLRFILWMYKL